MSYKSEIMRQKILNQANYYVNHKSTMRKTAKHFGIGKSTVHVNLSKRLKNICNDKVLLEAVLKQIEINTREKSKRGAMALKNKLQGSTK